MLSDKNIIAHAGGPVRNHATFDHGMVSRFNAWFFTAFAGYLNYIAHHHKQAAFGGIECNSTILEIGAGTGANLHHLPADTHLYALEPSLRMHDRLRRRCAAVGVQVTILASGAETIPLPDASVDEVICSLVLCTTPDPGRVLAEVRRVLKPGGRFRFVEHVASRLGKLWGWDLNTRSWVWLAGLWPRRVTRSCSRRHGSSARRCQRCGSCSLGL